MKKSISEALLMGAVVIIAGIFLLYGDSLTKKLEGVMGSEENNVGSEDYYFDDYISNVTTNESNGLSNISPFVSSDNKSSSISYQKNKVEDELNVEVDLDINAETNVSSKEASELRKLTEKNMEDIRGDEVTSDDYTVTYYKINDNSYVVGITNSDGSYSNYEYAATTSTFGNKKYELVNVSNGDSTDINTNLITSEKSKSFGYSIGYTNSYTSGISVNKTISSNTSTIDNIYAINKDKIIVLNTYKNDVIVNSATGFFIAPGIVATSWSYISDSIKNGTSIGCLDASYKNYRMLGVISINKESDIALLRVDTNTGGSVIVGNVNVGDEILLVGSVSGFGASGKIGINLVNDNMQINALNISSKNIGSPLFNSRGEVIGMVTGSAINNDLSYSVSSKYLSEYINLYSNTNLNNIKYTTFEALSKEYYSYDLSEEKVVTVPTDIITKYSSVGDLNKDIGGNLVEYNSTSEGISLRYLNDIEIDSNVILSSFISNLEDKGYKEVLNSTKKKIYKSDIYTVNIYLELDYIMVVIKEN